MKVKIYDTHVSTQDKYYHFDVVVKEKTQEEIEIYAKEYLKGIGVEAINIIQEGCLFCHEEVADAKMIESINKYGHHIIPMKGCPK